MLFGRKTTPTSPDDPTTSAPKEKSGGKGHATPSRKQAESANRRPLVPETRTKGSGASKEARAAARAQAREARDAEYRAMQTGDEAHMPVQHRGPVRRYIRDVVDSRRTPSEYFLPLALVMLLVAMVLSGPLSTQGTGGARIAMVLMLLPYVYLFVSVLDTIWRWRRLKPVLTSKFGAPGTARGTLGYFINRTYQMRRLRMPRPQVKPGGQPR